MGRWTFDAEASSAFQLTKTGGYMNNKMQDLLPVNLTFGNPFQIHGLGLIPLLSDHIPSIPQLEILDNAIENGAVTIQEVSEGGAVPFLLLENRGDKPVIILDGEEVLGGKQNRIINTTVIVMAGCSIRVNVSCVESGRWNYRSQNFTSGKSIFRASSRAVHKQGVTANLRRDGVPVSNQGAVWNEVERSLREQHLESRTADFQDVRQHVAHRIEEFVQAIQPVENQIGSIFFNHREVIGVELLATPDLFRRSHAKIVSSFAFEALSAPDLNGVSIEPVKAWWENVLNAPYSKHHSIGVGDDIRIQIDKIIGSGLVYGGVMTHLSCFPSAIDPLFDRRPARLNRRSIKQRYQNLRSTIGD